MSSGFSLPLVASRMLSTPLPDITNYIGWFLNKAVRGKQEQNTIEKGESGSRMAKPKRARSSKATVLELLSSVLDIKYAHFVTLVLSLTTVPSLACHRFTAFP